MKHVNFLFLTTILLIFWNQLFAQTDTTLKVWFTFNNASTNDTTITDESGNSYVGTLKNGATISTNGDIGRVLNLGDNNGYLDLGSAFGTKLISKLQDFTISTYIYIANDADITYYGNVLFSFGNSDKIEIDAKGYMFFSAKNTRYTISKTNWTEEKGVKTGYAFTKGTWKHLAITYTGTTAKIYIDGTAVAISTSISLAPKEIGATAYNHIGKSNYFTDHYLTKTLIDEFRIYNIALPDSMVSKLASSLTQLHLNEALATILLKDGQEIFTNLSLPTTINGFTISWSSSDSSTISPTGVIVRPVTGSAKKNVTLTAKAISDSITAIKQFNLIVLPAFSDTVAVKIDADSLTLSSKIKCLRSDLTLPKLGLQGSTIAWKSDLPSMLTDDGKLLNLAAKGTGLVKVILTATLTHGIAILSLPFEIFVADSSMMDTTLQARFTFDKVAANDTTITDESGNSFVGTLKNGASISQYDALGGILNLGSTNGYLDLGASFGANLISKLKDFTISTYIYIANDANITNNGNNVFSFGNSDNILTDANGCLSFSARNSRYAISKTNSAGDQGVQDGYAFTKGTWKHLAITYTGTTAKIYIDGTTVATSTSISLAPKEIGATAYNHIGKSNYSSAVYLTKTLIDEFRVYNVALPDSMIKKLASSLVDYRLTINKFLMHEALETISLKDGQEIISNLALPTIINGFPISWISSDTSAISPTGVVVRPIAGSVKKNVTLTAKAISGIATATKEFILIVLPALPDTVAVKTDADSLNLDPKIKCLRTDLTLPTVGLQGSTISWESDFPTLLTNNGKLLYLPAKGPVKITLTATITHGTAALTKTFNIYVAEKDPYSAYLFVHFTEGSESIRFAISDDGYNYKALNNDNPVLDAKSSTGGVRDPHILRGADGTTYYMVATDMMAANGWDSNRAIVLLKSTNLIDWQSSVVNIAATYSQFSDIKCAWAPQTIYDKTEGKYMIYWAMRIGSAGIQKIYHAYTNADFTALENAPELLFESPQGVHVIDADIIEKDSLFYLFYKTDSEQKGIKKAIASSLTGTYTEIDKFLDKTDYACEGSCVFRLIDSDIYILMYDVYGAGAGIYQFTKSTDLTNFAVIDNLITMDFPPKHGTVMPITKTERDALVAKWNPTSRPSNVTPAGKLIFTAIYQLNGILIGKNISHLKNGIYIRKRIYENGAVIIDKIFVNNENSSSLYKF